MFSAPDKYRVAAPRERTSDQENRQRFAKQHRNNAAGRVFAANASVAGVDARFVTALSTKQNQTEPGKYPGPLRSRQKFEMLGLKDQRHSTLVIS
jgi:hypothetical protein